MSRPRRLATDICASLLAQKQRTSLMVLGLAVAVARGSTAPARHRHPSAHTEGQQRQQPARGHRQPGEDGHGERGRRRVDGAGQHRDLGRVDARPRDAPHRVGADRRLGVAPRRAQQPLGLGARPGVGVLRGPGLGSVAQLGGQVWHGWS